MQNPRYTVGNIVVQPPKIYGVRVDANASKIDG